MTTRDELTREILKAAFEVHSVLGPGLMEATYAACLARELADAGIDFEREVAMKVVDKGMVLDSAYRADIVVHERVLIELKSVERLMPVHEAQVLTYMKFANLPAGLLLNFNVTRLKNGIRRFNRSS